MHIKPQRLRGLQYVDTHCVVGGIDRDYCRIEFYVIPPEPDVNEPGGVEIACIWFEDQGDIILEATEKELDQIANDMLEWCNDRYADYADYMYDQYKDRRAEDGV